MVVIIVLFNVNFPINCSKILIDIMHLANLDLVDMEEYIAAFFNFKLESPPFNQIFEEAGFESSTFVIELGLIFFLIFISITSYLIKLLFKFITRKFDENCITRRIR